MPPQTRYARSGEVNIAYQVHGDGPIDVLMNVGLISHLEHLWEEPGVVRMFDGLAEFSRLILMDRRGTGLSDPAGDLPIEEELDDITAVLDAAGSERAALFGHTASGPFVAHYAARRPDRVGALILYAATAVPVGDEEAPWALSAEQRWQRLDEMTERWGTGNNLHLMGPIAAVDPRVREWFGRLERLAASPGAVRTLTRNLERYADPRPIMPLIEVPTLVLHRKHDGMMDPRHSLVWAERVPGARYVELPGDETLIFLGDTEAVAGEVEEFLTGTRRGTAPQRQLLTVLFTDICDGTARAAELGDKRWRDLLSSHDAIIRRELSRQHGRQVKTIGDGVLAVFDGPPSQAVRAARAINAATGPLGVDVRLGMHTGECELIGDDVGGMAVHIAARVSAIAGPQEVLASGTTFGTVVGAGFEWEYQGDRDLKGVPGRWPIFRLRG